MPAVIGLESLLLRIKKPTVNKGSDSEYVLVVARDSGEVKDLVATAFSENPTLALIARSKIA